MKKIIIDIDGVTCDHAGPICEWVNTTFGLSVTPNSVTSWEHDFGPVTFVEAVDSCYPKYDFIQSMEVSDGFMEFYKSISGHLEILFATARKDYCKKSTIDWMNNHFPGESLVFTRNKAMLTGYDYLIDDYHKECVSCANQGVVGLLLGQPWNNTDEVKGIISKYDSVIHCPTFLDALNEITKT